VAAVRAAAIYARISSDQDGTGLGVERQLEDCRRAAAQLGWTVAEEYVDNDISASRYSRKARPAYSRMMTDIRDGLRDAVVVYHVDRLTRRPIELEDFVAAIEAAKLRHVRFVVGDSDVTTGDGLLAVRIMASVAAHESATKSRRLQRKAEQIAASGMPNGGARRPFGYERDRMTVNKAEAAIFKQLVKRFLAGESIRSMTMWLTEQSVPTVTGSEWRTMTVRAMLMNPRYAGIRTLRGAVYGPAAWPSIITEEQHRRILAKAAQKQASGRRQPRRYLLSGMLRCGRCGNGLFSMVRQTTRRYVCLSGPDHGGCGRLTVVAPPLETLMSEGVLYRLDTPELADALAGRMAADDQAMELSGQLEADQAQLDEAATAYTTRQITMREWLLVRDPIEARIRDSQRRIANLTGATDLANLVGQGAALRATWGELNLDRQVAIVRAVLDHAVIAPGVPGSRALDPARVRPVWRL
jgi:DNA invertase Pin-like site-specific DNA recombinase